MFISSIDFQGLLPVMVKTWFVFLVNAKLLQCSEIGQSQMLRDKASNSRYLETPWTNYFFIQVELVRENLRTCFGRYVLYSNCYSQTFFLSLSSFPFFLTNLPQSLQTTGKYPQKNKLFKHFIVHFNMSHSDLPYYCLYSTTFWLKSL